MAKKKFYKRAKNVSFEGVTERDISILKALYRYRFLTTDLIHRLLFHETTMRVAQRRVRKLFDLGLCGRRPVVKLTDPNNPLTSGMVHFLDVVGAEYLGIAENTRRLRKHNQVSVGTVNHFLMTNQFMVELELACTLAKYRFAEHQDEIQLKGEYDRVTLTEGSKNVKVAVIPDTYVAIQTPHHEEPSHLLLETDTGTEKSSIIKRKVRAYIKYLKSDDIMRRFGSQKMRVLFVAKTNRRANNLKSYAEEMGGEKRFWFGSLDEIEAEKLFYKPLWEIASQSKKGVLLPPPPE